MIKRLPNRFGLRLKAGSAFGGYGAQYLVARLQSLCNTVQDATTGRTCGNALPIKRAAFAEGLDILASVVSRGKEVVGTLKGHRHICLLADFLDATAGVTSSRSIVTTDVRKAWSEAIREQRTRWLRSEMTKI